MDLNQLLAQWWPSLGPTTLQTTGQGTSNTIYFVDAQAGQFVLKLYGDTTASTQIEYEHALLKHLQKAGVSFAVPAPIPAASGETLIFVEDDTPPLPRAALLPLLPGQSGNRKNLRHTRAAGRALGELHRALAGFDPEGQMAQLPSWGDLYHIHPLVTDPLEVPQSLMLNLNQQARLLKTLTEVVEAKPRLYTTLPIQTVHADYLSPNIVLEQDQVVGILDFEFATRDLRLMDYICGLDHFALFPWKGVAYWDFVQAFCMGYAEYVSLTVEEVQALLVAWRLQRASSIIYWTGWLREGKATHQSVMDAVNETPLLEDWFQDNSAKLLSYVQSLTV